MKHISPADVQEDISSGQLFVLDVREQWEHEEDNLGGLNIPLADIITQAAKIPYDRPVLVYCRKGVRSQIAIQRLQQKFGFDNLINLDGGILAFRKLKEGS